MRQTCSRMCRLRLRGLFDRIRHRLAVIKKYLCNERVVHVRYVAIDNLVITTPLKKRYSRPLVMLW